MEPIEQVRNFLADLVGGPDTHFMVRRRQAEEFSAAFVMPDGIVARSGELGGIPVEWVTPDGALDVPVLLHLHGGGYVLGDPAGSRALTTELARLTGARVVSIDYRLGPEEPYPCAINDALNAYEALIRSVPPQSISVGGESAGGGLTLALLLAIRDKALPMPACAFAISPWTDLTCEATSFDTKAGVDPLLTRQALRQMAKAYLGASDPRAPYASPLFGDLRDLPPLLIHVGSEEVLLDDSLSLHRAARAAGVRSRIKVADRMIHVWHMFHAMLPEGAVAICEIAEFLEQHWKRPTKPRMDVL